MTRQFFEASGSHGDLMEKTNKQFVDEVNGSMCAKFQVCIVSEWPGGVTNKQTNTYIHTHIQVILRISSTGCSSYVDFDYIN